jgi:hypothetical protein
VNPNIQSAHTRRFKRAALKLTAGFNAENPVHSKPPRTVVISDSKIYQPPSIETILISDSHHITLERAHRRQPNCPVHRHHIRQQDSPISPDHQNHHQPSKPLAIASCRFTSFNPSAHNRRFE